MVAVTQLDQLADSALGQTVTKEERCRGLCLRLRQLPEVSLYEECLASLKG
jgi:hypothetical protein